MDINKISVGKNPPEDINVIIEIQSGQDPIKYEMDKESGAIFVDRIIHTSMRYPCNYGFIPHTLSNDGDPVDVLVVSGAKFIPGCVVRCRPVGVLKMTDQSGEDEKILAVPVDDLHPYYTNIKEYGDLPEILMQQISHFFTHYKDLEVGKWVRIDGWASSDVAKKFITDGIERHNKSLSKKSA